MSSYPNILTPPSSNDDSPSNFYYNSPSSSLSPPENMLLPETSKAFDLDDFNLAPAPFLQITEQPVSRFRFRYRSEMTGTHGSLCGQSSDKTRRQTFPTVQLCNFNKKAKIRCSIYQVSKENHKPHAHRLIKKYGRGELDDPHDIDVSPEVGFTYCFHNMGIIHTAKKNIVPELIKKKRQLKKEEIAKLERKKRDLNMREDIEIKGLAEAESKFINLNVVCLRFDAFYDDDGILLPLCPPVYSQSINNLKSALTGELKIVRMDHCTSPARGNREIFILVERVTKKNIKVKFYEVDDEDLIVWEDYGKFSDLDVHHQYAIVFKTPPYKDVNIKTPVKVYIELERPSDQARSEAKEFTYTCSTNFYKPGQKRARPSYDSLSYDTSLNSDELPLPINDLSIDTIPNSFIDDMTLQVTSTELQQALTNINSDEFQRIFDDFGNDYSSAESLRTDAPVMKRKFGEKNDKRSMKNKVYQSKMYTDSVEETILAKHAVVNLKNFLKTIPNNEKAINMLRNYLMIENKTNPLHVLIRRNDSTDDIMFLLKMIYVWKQYDLLNTRNECHETALHIATYLNLEEIVSNLIVCQADVTVADDDMNTALHLAVITNASVVILEKLLSVDYCQKFIDAENLDGNTALDLAIENNNFKALKLLCLRGVDINKRHKKNGFTPLRFAIEKPNLDILRFILQMKGLDPMVEDFQDVNPLQAGLKKDNTDVVDIITNFMETNNYVDMEIKHEIEDSEEEIEEKFSVKMEHFTEEEMDTMYQKATYFTSECLDKIAEILDRSGSWESLAELLDLGHLMRSGLYDSSNSSPTRFVLKVAIETNGDTVLQIKNFLDNLDEKEAVEVINNMVKTEFS